MNRIFNKLVNALQKKPFDGLSEDMPEIEWVKAVTMKIFDTTIIMKAEDGRFFMRDLQEEKPVWLGMINGEERSFRSPYLDSVLADAQERGMKRQLLSASDIRQHMSSLRIHIIGYGTNEQFENLYKMYPEVPEDFNDYHVPEDFDGSHPDFANYLRKEGYVPFRLKPEGAAATQKQQPQLK